MSAWWAANVHSIAWATVYGLTAVVLAAGAYRVAFDHPASAGCTGRFWASCLLACGVVPALDFVETFAVGAPSGGKFLAQAALLMTGLALATFLLGRPAKSSGGGPWASRHSCAITLILLALPTMLWASHRLFEKPESVGPVVLGIDFQLPSDDDLRELPAVELRTDRGTRIAAYRLLDAVANGEELNNWLAANSRRYARNSIAVAPPETQSNCHGWVFAAGQCFIRGTDVDCILAENDYVAAPQPEPDDLVVYRDEQGGVVHSGVVKAVGREGFALVESKWGFYGRFLHEAREQCYSPLFAYYRSSRNGHCLKGR